MYPAQRRQRIFIFRAFFSRDAHELHTRTSLSADDKALNVFFMTYCRCGVSRTSQTIRWAFRCLFEQGDLMQHSRQDHPSPA